MDQLMSLLKEFELGDILPEADAFVVQLRGWMTTIMLIGPILLLAVGVWLYFFPRPKMNDPLGFRGLFRTKDMAVWKRWQHLGGLLYGVLGIVLLSVFGILCLTFGGMSPDTMAGFTVICVSIEAALTLGIWIAVQIIAHKK